MQLPSQPIVGTRQDPRIMLLYGAPKVGKTTKLAELENCLIIDIESGTDYISALKVQVKDYNEWKELAKELRKEPLRYKSIAIDTITTLEDWAEELALANYKKSAVGKNFTGSSILTLPNGGGYLWLRLAFKELIDDLSGVTTTLILVAHLKEKMLETAGKEVAIKDIDLTGKLRSIVCSMADAVGYVYREYVGLVGKLMITFKSSEQVLCGSRCPHLRGQVLEFDWKNIFKGEKSSVTPIMTNVVTGPNLGMLVPVK